MKRIIPLIFLITLYTINSYADDGDWKLGIGVGISDAFSVSLVGNGINSGIPYNESSDLDYQQSVVIEISYSKYPKNAWGIISGFQYEMERTLWKSTVTVSGGTQALAANPSKYQVDFLYIGTAYRWDSFYIPFGISYGLINYTPINFPGSATVSNGFGSILGVGWFINNDMAIEIGGRSALTKLNMISGSNTESNTGMIFSGLVNLKYLF